MYQFDNVMLHLLKSFEINGHPETIPSCLNGLALRLFLLNPEKFRAYVDKFLGSNMTHLIGQKLRLSVPHINTEKLKSLHLQNSWMYAWSLNCSNYTVDELDFDDANAIYLLRCLEGFSGNLIAFLNAVQFSLDESFFSVCSFLTPFTSPNTFPKMHAHLDYFEQWQAETSDFRIEIYRIWKHQWFGFFRVLPVGTLLKDILTQYLQGDLITQAENFKRVWYESTNVVVNMPQISPNATIDEYLDALCSFLQQVHICPNENIEELYISSKPWRHQKISSMQECLLDMFFKVHAVDGFDLIRQIVEGIVTSHSFSIPTICYGIAGESDEELLASLIEALPSITNPELRVLLSSFVYMYDQSNTVVNLYASNAPIFTSQWLENDILTSDMKAIKFATYVSCEHAMSLVPIMQSYYIQNEDVLNDSNTCSWICEICVRLLSHSPHSQQLLDMVWGRCKNEIRMSSQTSDELMFVIESNYSMTADHACPHHRGAILRSVNPTISLSKVSWTPGMNFNSLVVSFVDDHEFSEHCDRLQLDPINTKTAYLRQIESGLKHFYLTNMLGMEIDLTSFNANSGILFGRRLALEACFRSLLAGNDDRFIATMYQLLEFRCEDGVGDTACQVLLLLASQQHSVHTLNDTLCRVLKWLINDEIDDIKQNKFKIY